MIRGIAIFAFIGICFFGNAQSSKPQVLFSIKNETVTDEEFIYLYKKNHQNKEDYTKQKIEEYINLFINFKLKVKEARNRGIDTTAAFVKEYNSYKDELRKPYLPEGKIVDSLVKVTYKRLQEEIRASHILINCKPDAAPADTLVAFNKALEIKNMALGGKDFGTLAMTYSDDPSAKTNKGDLGYFTALQMVFPFENAVYAGKKKDVVGPVRTRFGYHIIKIDDRIPARGEVEVSHIMIRTGERDEAAAKNLIFEIHDQLQGGVSWNELCKQYSDDPSTKNTGGRLRAFGSRAMASVPEFERAAFALQKPGEISDPVQSQYGWHVIRLEKKIPPPSFEQSAANLKNLVARDERVQVSKAALMNKLKNDFGFSENSSTKTALFALADSTLTAGKWKVNSLPNEKEVLFSIRAVQVSVADFVKYVKQNQRQTGFAPTKYIEQLYNSYVEQAINTQLEKKIIQEHPEFEHLLKEYYEGILLFDIMEKEVWKKASDDSVGQQKFYQQNKQKYTAGERIQAVVYASTSAGNIANLKTWVAKNDSVEVQKAITTKAVRQETGTYQKTDRPVFEKIEWKVGLYTAETNGTHYLVQVKKMVPPGLMSFEEARTPVISDYQDHLEKTWLAQLKKKYPVKVNAKVKSYVLENLKP